MLYVRKQSIRKFPKCNWYVKKIDTMETQKMKWNIKTRGTRQILKNRSKKEEPKKSCDTKKRRYQHNAGIHKYIKKEISRKEKVEDFL